MRLGWIPFSGSPWVPLVGALGVLIVLACMRRSREVLFPFGIYYFYLSFGPVLNYLLGKPIYAGVVETKIYAASVVFFLALAGIAIGAVFAGRASQDEFASSFAHVRRYAAVPVVMGGLCLYPLYVVFDHGVRLLNVAKPERIALVNPTWHYAYLLVEFFVGALYFIVRRERLWLRLFYVNMGLYVAYCVIMSERDFMFVAAAIVLHRFALDGVRLRPRFVIVAVAMLYAATYMFQARLSQTDVGVADVLNQGSLLFVDSFVINLVDGGAAMLHGQSYHDAVLNVLPGQLNDSGINLSVWLADVYAPGSTSKYGFSLSAEAYLNFGYAAVPLVFAAVAFVQAKLLAHAKRHPGLSFASVFYTAFLMYAVRGDSLMLLNGVLYAAIFFALLEATAIPERVYRRSERRRRAGVSLPPVSPWINLDHRDLRLRVLAALSRRV